MGGGGCGEAESGGCVDRAAARRLQLAGIGIILAASAVGVCMPLLGRVFPALAPGRRPFVVLKAFAAGVILGTAFVHMLPDAFETLADPCLPEHPWGSYPFAGLIAMFSALFTLLVDSSANSYYQGKNQRLAVTDADADAGAGADADAVADADAALEKQAHPSHFHAHRPVVPEALDADSDAVGNQIRHRIISQVLEAGIVAHSVLIGVALGTSMSPCTVRPLLAALTFHQFFEGIALGGCIAQGGFKSAAKFVMGLLFVLTTPIGIAIGIAIASGYDEKSTAALLVSGIFDSISAGILVYMALVDLIATDIASTKLRTSVQLQLYYYVALFCGAGAMSLLGYWA